jgi:hypothetical protein
MSRRLDALLECFPVTGRLESVVSGGSPDPVFQEFFDEVGGTTLGNGFYRFHTAATSSVSDLACAKLVKGLAGRMRCFAVDWLGREIAADVRPGRPQMVIIVDPGGGEYLSTPCDLDDWHDAVVDSDLDPLAWTFYAAWREANPAFGELGFDQAIGYRVPRFPGRRGPGAESGGHASGVVFRDLQPAAARYAGDGAGHNDRADSRATVR